MLRKPNEWINHVKAFKTSHPTMAYSECILRARESYTPINQRLKKVEVDTPLPMKKKSMQIEIPQKK